MPPDDTTHENRKLDHLRINLNENVQFRQTTNGLEHYRFVHQALPEINLDEISLSAHLFGKTLHAPILISSIVGFDMPKPAKKSI